MTNQLRPALRFTATLAFLLLSAGPARAANAADPYLWLEEVESERSLNWVKQQNDATTAALEATPHYAKLKANIHDILFAKDNVPFAGSFRYGYFYNFWQDAKNKHGLIRRAPLAEYRKASPQWDVILDLDALSKKENENWVYKGATTLDQGSSRNLLQLSRGGKDAVMVREYDYETRQFITDGFNVPEAKTNVTPYDKDLVFFSSNLNPEETTNAGYGNTIKLWKRGQPVTAAQTIFTVQKTDALVSATVYRDGKAKHVVITRAMDFYHGENYLWEANTSPRLLPLPVTANLLDVQDGMVYGQLKDDLDLGSRQIPSNSVIRFALNATDLNAAEVVFTADPRQTIQGIDVRKNGIYVNLLDNVQNRILLLKQAGGAWRKNILPFPSKGEVSFEPRSDVDPTSLPLLTYTDYLTPKTQYLVHDEDGSYRLDGLKSAPARFDAQDLEVKQDFAKSADGTSVPYFIIKKKNLALDGKNPTVLYGYGGFEISMTPYYSGVIGKSWLEPGGVYVVANIRGGGEFGPSWHQSALKHNRQRSYDDFIAVAEDLIAKGVTSPAHLGIQGGSNGGLLVGAVMVQRPELFNAVLCQVPLLDMVRYSQLLAGASWIGEYGDPANADDLAYLLTYSPYQNLRADRSYPTPLFTTSTKDDRVHPGHARKFAARMAEFGKPFYFYENVNGGHAGSADLEETTHMTAMEYSYLWSRLR